jgi:transposase
VISIYENYKNYKHDEFELAEKFGVSLTTIYDIVRGRSWGWLKLKPVYRRKPNNE